MGTTKGSEEWKKQISEACKGRPAWNKGLSPSEESRKRMRESHLGKKQSPELVAKRMAALEPYFESQRGVPKTGERLEQCREAIKVCVAKTRALHASKKHYISDVVGRVGTCSICGRVPLKLSKGQLACRLARCGAKVRYLGQALELWEAQAGNCGVCFAPMKDNGKDLFSVATEHDHKTHFLRSFAHAGCNKILGLALENPERLRQAADYLERHLLS